MARYQIILAYDGTDFLGSQRQVHARTIQGELEKALTKLGWQGRTVLLAGRTDTGVHASGQVAAFDLDWGHGLDDLTSALNANLPGDMAVRQAREAPQDFQPRFDATSRLYRYRLFCESARDPLRERYAWRVWPKVGDLRGLDFNEEFEGVYNWGGSFGYFSDEENADVLRRYVRALRPGGGERVAARVAAESGEFLRTAGNRLQLRLFALRAKEQGQRRAGRTIPDDAGEAAGQGRA
jgi:tRNA U38,U39,U40 pseudouridine synthase TruA